jgi:hypothetical protein
MLERLSSLYSDHIIEARALMYVLPQYDALEVIRPFYNDHDIEAPSIDVLHYTML